MANLKLELVRVVDTPIDAVFAAWTDEKALREWASPEGLTVDEAASDGRLGGAYFIKMVDPVGGIHLATGTYTLFEPPHRFIKSWQWQEGGGGGGLTQLSVTLRAVDADRTEIRLVHEHFTSEDARQSHEGGWVTTLNRLEAYLASER